MINATLGRKVVAMFAAAAILSVYATLTLATPGVRGAELSVFGKVALNGHRAISGETVFSECLIVTAQGSSASVSLGKLGRIELSANTNLRLSFADNITGSLESGTARISSPSGVFINFTTPDGSVVVDGSQPTSFSVKTENGITTLVTESGQAELRSGTATIRVAAGESLTAGMLQSTKNDDGAGRTHGGSFWGAWLATGSVIAAAIWVVTHEKPAHEDDLDFGGTVVNPSPR